MYYDSNAAFWRNINKNLIICVLDIRSRNVSIYRGREDVCEIIIALLANIHNPFHGTEKNIVWHLL